MNRFFILIVTLSILLVSGCSAVPSIIKPALEEEGEVYIYLEPFPQEAARLRFQFDGLVALRSDGAGFPLSLSVNDLTIGILSRQRLIAAGRVAPGHYSGLSFTVRNAVLRSEEGEVALRAPDQPVRINVPFDIHRKKAVVLSLALHYAESVKGGSRFEPSFTVSIPPKPLLTLSGYATNHNSHTVTVFDKKTGQVTGVIPTGNGPLGMALDQRRGRAYIALTGDDAIEVIDVAEESITNRLNLAAGDRPRELALTRDGKLLLSVNNGSHSVSFIDPVSLIEISRVAVGNDPQSVLVDQAGTRAYIFNALSNSISVIDIANKTIVTTISTEPGPMRGQFNRRGNALYVIFEGSPYLLVIDPFLLTTVKRTFVGPGVSSIKVDTSTDMIYLAKKYAGIIEMYDPFSLMPGYVFTVGGGVAFMTIDGQENNLSVVLQDKKTVAAINLISKKIAFEMDAGDSPAWVAMMGER